MNVLKEKWYPVGPPWGDGTWAVAGHHDPHTGKYVFDCQDMTEWTDVSSGMALAAEIVEHICNLHNAALQPAVQANAGKCGYCKNIAKRFRDWSFCPFCGQPLRAA